MWLNEIVDKIPFLNNTTTFFFGDTSNISHLMDNIEVYNYNPNFMHLPFEKVLYEYYVGDYMNKCAFYCKEEETALKILLLNYNSFINWIPTVKITIDKKKPNIHYELVQKDLPMKEQEVDSMLSVFFVMNKLLTCNNVEKQEVKPKYTRKMIRRGEVPPYSYYILTIKQGNKRNKVLNENTIEQNRIHFCRGHFKEFTKEKPLLGKYIGIYWWEPQLRGNNTKGIIEKDYFYENEIP